MGYVNGQPYYGEFHTMAGGNKMTGATHTVGSQQITDVPQAAATAQATSSSGSQTTSNSGY